MKYETFNPEIHDVTKVAKLVYDVDFRTFDMLFKNPKNAVGVIANDLRKNKIEYHFKIILDDDDDIFADNDVSVVDEEPILMENVEPLHKVDTKDQAAKDEFKSIMDFFNTL